MSQTYDCIVLGVGGFGSSALYHLARRGVRALGIEQFGAAHDRGSSHGETRIIRKAYFEHADYVPLLHRAYALWAELEAETGRKLNHSVGLFLAGPANGEAVPGTEHAARQHHLPIESLTAAQARLRFPGYRFPDDFSVVFEQQAGYLEVEACVAAHIERACAQGARLVTDERVLEWSCADGAVRLRTDRNVYHAARLIVTAGPWTAPILADLHLPLQVVRKPVFWFDASDLYDVSAGNSTFFFDRPDGQFYGFPRLDGRTIKAAEHTGGEPVANPMTVDRGTRPDDLTRLARFIADCLPGVHPQPVRHSVCLYTRTPDGHFIIDRHPVHAPVVLAAGFSGHGFKFTSVLGEVLADLSLNGATSQPIGFLSLSRAALA